MGEMMLEKAFKISYMAHKDQVDKGGAPYYLHPIFVALNMETEDQKIVALLHDVVEDTEITLDDLRQEGFSENIVDAVDAITKKGEAYEVYLQKVKANALARAVKIGDLKHNSDITRLKNPTEKDIKRIEKYKKSLDYLLAD